MSDTNREVNELLADSLSGKISRRDVVKRAGVLGLSAPLAGVLVSAYGRSASAQDATPTVDVGSTIVVPEGIRTDLAGQKLTVILGASGSGTPYTQALVAKFQEATGIETNLIEGPESATDRLNIAYLPVLSAGSSDIDVFMIDVIWPGILAEHAVDLAPAVAETGNTYFERIVNNNTVDGSLVGVPWFTDAGLMYYRKDLLEKYGVAVPTTWAEFEAAATTMQEGERAAGNPDFWGYVFQGAAYEGLTCNAIEWQISMGGGNVIESDGTVSVNNEAAAAAFDRARTWVGTVAPEGVTTYKEEEARGVWQGGNAGFMRNWPYAFSLGQAADSPIKDKFDVTLIPKGEGEGGQNADCLGGWQLMVSKYSKSQEAAIEFVKFATSFEIQKSQAIERSLLPTIAAVYDDADVLAANPFFAALKDVFQGGAVPRPSTVSGAFYDDVSTAYFTAVNQVLTGQAKAADVLATLGEDLQAIMDEKNG